ncbi:3-oxoacyl-[acyl-carrier protein] reductase [Serinicoccus hydrothermalis]|uniref:3-oxoacyl-[acyl-carrier protein] reductase n=1 Tax=Serinicoccus hydrothermalis TaxID=1758689 RepID=A0A1B1N9I6_9MICO|nr:SDR family oxidoreductase [Serinicoccus hydrothermalis]ANS78089.1 3-oxoacyl-[acyl-carrier protein] reductase [Serinicoccus hydrothermalis]
MTTLELDGQVALVTGGSRGIGLAVAQQLHDLGASVVLTARGQEALDEAAAGIGERASGIAGKADDPEHREQVLDTIAQQHGRLDILVNNAGINPAYGPLVELDLGVARKTFEVNVVSTLAWVQLVLAHEGLGFRSHGGRVVNVSSVSGAVPSEGIGLYGISKAAVNQLTRTLAVELGPEVRVNAVAPAVIKTQFSKALYEGREEEVAADYPLGRLGEPDDVAQAVAFLVTDQSAWITGQVLDLDGGLLVAGGSA